MIKPLIENNATAIVPSINYKGYQLNSRMKLLPIKLKAKKGLIINNS